MVRVDHYSHLDDPFNYFRRLESYSSSRPSSFSRPSSYADSPTPSVFPVRPHSHFGPKSYSEIDCVLDSDKRSRSESYSSSQVHSYTDSGFQTYTSEKSTRRRQSRSFREYRSSSNAKTLWTKKRKVILSLSLAILVVIAIVAGVVIHLRETAYHYTPSYAHVTNEAAFASGGATHRNPNDTADGTSSGLDQYIYYSGGPERFPLSSSWTSFDAMWQANLQGIQSSCNDLGYGPDDSSSQIQDIYNAIQNRANVSFVDHRFILAVILQESHGCVYVSSTSSASGVRNPGLMQSHNGHSFSSAHPSLSILAMIQDGTQGTQYGHGLVQNLNIYGNLYSAARGYNSGVIAASGNLSEGVGATACYVSDIANRLTGWVHAKSTCPGDDRTP